MSLSVFVVVACLSAGGLVAGVIRWRRWRLHQAIQQIAREIKPPRQRFPVLSPKDMDLLLARAEARRERADGKRVEGAKIDSGEPERKIQLASRR